MFSVILCVSGDGIGICVDDVLVLYGLLVLVIL